MKAIIIEDEELTAERLTNLVEKHTELEIEACLHSVKSAVEWINSNPTPDLIFLDIQLGDGSGFDVLDQIKSFPHIVFTTAFDQYAIDAFKYNSIDYLLKPIKAEDLKITIEKLNKLTVSQNIPGLLSELRSQVKKYKQKFLVKVGLKYHSFQTNEISYFYSEEGETYLRTKDGQNCIIDHTLDALETIINPEQFFRVNRHMIVHSDQITSIDAFFNNRLSLEVSPIFHETVIVSRDRVKAFKQWMDE